MPSDITVTALATQLTLDPEQQDVLTAQRAVDLGVGMALRMLHRDRRQGESLQALFDRLGPAQAARLEAETMLLLDGIRDASEHGVLILMYHTLVSGRWVHEATRADLSGDFRSFIYWLLLNPGRPGGPEFKQKEVARWVETCLLVQQLYLQQDGVYPWRERLGLDDDLFPGTPDEALALYGARWGRAAYSLLNTARELAGTRSTYAGLKALVDAGRLDPDGPSEAARAWKLIAHGRHLFGVMTDLSQPQRRIDQAAAGSQPLAVPPLVITQEVTPSQKAEIKRKLPFAVFPDDAPIPQSEVRYLAELLPVCPTCEPMRVCSIEPLLNGENRFACPACGRVTDGGTYTQRWWVQWHTGYAMTRWFLAGRPSLEDWTPGTVTVAGIRCLIYTTWQGQDAIERLEEQYCQEVTPGETR